MKKDHLIDIIACMLILLLFYAACSKLFNYGEFRFQLGRSPFIDHIAGLVVWSIPAAEIAIAVLLIPKKTRLLGFYGSFVLMFLFTGYIYAMLRYSPFLPCSCGGVLGKMSWNQHLKFNIFFTLLPLIAILMSRTDKVKKTALMTSHT